LTIFNKEQEMARSSKQILQMGSFYPMQQYDGNRETKKKELDFAEIEFLGFVR